MGLAAVGGGSPAPPASADTPYSVVGVVAGVYYKTNPGGGILVAPWLLLLYHELGTSVPALGSGTSVGDAHGSNWQTGYLMNSGAPDYATILRLYTAGSSGPTADYKTLLPQGAKGTTWSVRVALSQASLDAGRAGIGTFILPSPSRQQVEGTLPLPLIGRKSPRRRWWRRS